MSVICKLLENNSEKSLLESSNKEMLNYILSIDLKSLSLTEKSKVKLLYLIVCKETKQTEKNTTDFYYLFESIGLDFLIENLLTNYKGSSLTIFFKNKSILNKIKEYKSNKELLDILLRLEEKIMRVDFISIFNDSFKLEEVKDLEISIERILKIESIRYSITEKKKLSDSYQELIKKTIENEKNNRNKKSKEYSMLIILYPFLFTEEEKKYFIENTIKSLQLFYKELLSEEKEVNFISLKNNLPFLDYLRNDFIMSESKDQMENDKNKIKKEIINWSIKLFNIKDFIPIIKKLLKENIDNLLILDYAYEDLGYISYDAEEKTYIQQACFIFFNLIDKLSLYEVLSLRFKRKEAFEMILLNKENYFKEKEFHELIEEKLKEKEDVFNGERIWNRNISYLSPKSKIKLLSEFEESFHSINKIILEIYNYSNEDMDVSSDDFDLILLKYKD